MNDEILVIVVIYFGMMMAFAVFRIALNYMAKKSSFVLRRNTELKKKFCAYYKNPLEEGLIKIIASDKLFVLCNLADTMYGVFYHVDEEEYGAFGIFVEPKQAVKIAKEEGYFEELFLFYKENDGFDNRRILLNEETLGKLSALKEERLTNGPPELIDKEFEESIAEQ